MKCVYVFISILLVSCGKAASNTEETGESDEYNVLMLGNSYTSQNGGLDTHLQFLFDSTNGVSGQVEKLTGGGLGLSQHALGWDGSILDTKTYDFIILQDQSQVPSFPFYEASYIGSRDGAIVLDERVEAAGAETIFFMTWGYRLGDQRNTWLSPDYLSMQSNLERGYRGYAEAITEPTRTPYIAPVGLAFKKIYDDIIAEGGTPTSAGSLFSSLYKGDNSHPSHLAAYLAACVMFSTITGGSTINMPDNSGIDDNTRLKLQQAADSVVFDNSLDYGYPWESSNVPPPVQSEFPTESPSTAPSEPPSETPSSAPSVTTSTAPNETPSTASSETPSETPSMAPSVLPASSQGPNTPNDSGTKATMFRSVNEIFLFGIPLLIAFLA